MDKTKKQEYDRLRYQRLREAIRGQQRQYYQANRKRLAARARRRYWKRKIAARSPAA
jgi:hypothetical protein